MKEKILHSTILNRSIELLCEHGISYDHALIISKNLLEADICNVPTHGIKMLKAHIKKIQNQQYNIHPNIQEIRSGQGFSVFNSDNGIGMLTADYCMNQCINRAYSDGIHLTFAQNANTYSAAFVYAKKALEKGCIGITACNTPPQMAPWGGLEKKLGSNPFSIAIPAFLKAPIIIDMATTAVAKSKINMMAATSQSLPLGWAINKDGIETTNAQEALEGSVLPMGGAKGYCLAMMIDILAGVLSNSGYLTSVNKFFTDTPNSSMNVGHFFMVLNPEKIMGQEFYKIMDSYITELENTPSIIPDKKIHIPGQNKHIQNPKDQTIELDKESLDFLGL